MHICCIYTYIYFILYFTLYTSCIHLYLSLVYIYIFHPCILFFIFYSRVFSLLVLLLWRKISPWGLIKYISIYLSMEPHGTLSLSLSLFSWHSEPPRPPALVCQFISLHIQRSSIRTIIKVFLVHRPGSWPCARSRRWWGGGVIRFLLLSVKVWTLAACRRPQSKRVRTKTKCPLQKWFINLYGRDGNYYGFTGRHIFWCATIFLR